MSGDGSGRHNACVRARVLPPPPISAVQADRKVDARIPHTNIKSVRFRRLDGEHWTGSVADVGRCLFSTVCFNFKMTNKVRSRDSFEVPNGGKKPVFFYPSFPKSSAGKIKFSPTRKSSSLS